MTSEVRKSIDDILSTLKARLAAPGASLIPALRIMGRFTRYSLHNQLLILAQCPEASRVLGYRAWQNAGFQVRKGEKGIAIYAPMRLWDCDDVSAPTAADPSSGEANPESAFRLRYRVAYVFDVSQVDAMAGALTDPVTTSETDAPALLASALDALKAFLTREGLALQYTFLRTGCYGYTDGRTITCAAGLSPTVELATLIHETTHALLHFERDQDGSSGRPLFDLTTRETEAEAVTFILCEQLGLPESDTQASVDYIRSYRGTAETLDASLERIHATIARLAPIVPDPPPPPQE